MLGMIAGSGKLPVLAARKAKQQQMELAVFAVSSAIDDEVEQLADVYSQGSAGEVNKALRFLRDNNCQQVLFLGKVEKQRLFKGLKLDWGAVRVLSRIRHRSDDAIMNAVVNLLESKGHTVLSQAEFLSDLLTPMGVIGSAKPTAPEKNDLEFGFEMAKQLSLMGIGQTVVVKRGMVLAVEALEGTSEAIVRGCGLCEEGAVVVKVAKSGRDGRYDLPTVGLSTIEVLCEGKAGAIGLEAGSVLMVERDEMVEMANKYKLAIVGLSASES